MLSRNNALSVKEISPAKQQDFMKKLNKRKIRWIVREMDKREVGAWTIARIQDISSQHARKVYNKSKIARILYCSNLAESQEP